MLLLSQRKVIRSRKILPLTFSTGGVKIPKHFPRWGFVKRTFSTVGDAHFPLVGVQLRSRPVPDSFHFVIRPESSFYHESPFVSSNIFCYSRFRPRSLAVFCDRLRPRRVPCSVHALCIAAPATIRKGFFLLFGKRRLNLFLIRLARVLPQKAFRNLFCACLVSGLNVALNCFQVSS